MKVKFIPKRSFQLENCYKPPIKIKWILLIFRGRAFAQIAKSLGKLQESFFQGAMPMQAATLYQQSRLDPIRSHVIHGAAHAKDTKVHTLRSIFLSLTILSIHLMCRPRSDAGKKTTKKRKLAGGTQSQSTLARDDSSGSDDEQVQDEDDFELEQRERRLKELEEKALRARQLDMKAAQLEAERDEARRRAEMQHQEREERKREREAHEHDLQQGQKKKTAKND